MNDGFEGIVMFYRVNKVSPDHLAQTVLQAQWYVQTIASDEVLKWESVFSIISFSPFFSPPVSQRAHLVCLALKETLALKVKR